jgi:hypothetical protein
MPSDTPVNLAPSGVIQNPGIGGILGQGFSQLAQYLMAQEQQRQQQANEQARLGQGQQQINLESSNQSFQQAQAKAAQQTALDQKAEQQRQAGVFGQGIQALQPQSYQVPGMDMGAPTQLGGPSAPGYATPSTTGTTSPTLGTALAPMSMADASAFLASPAYKAFMETRKADMDSREIMAIGDTPFGKYTGQPVGPQVTPPKPLPEPSQVVLGQMGLTGTETGAQLVNMPWPGHPNQTRLTEFNGLMSKHYKEAVPQPSAPQRVENAFSTGFGAKSADQIVGETPIIAKETKLLPALDEMVTLLQQGKVNAGAFGTAKQAIANAAVSMGIASPSEIASATGTAYYQSLVADIISSVVKDFASRGLTQGDIPFVERFAQGKMNATPQSMIEGLQFLSKTIRRTAADHNATIDAIHSGVVARNMTSLQRINIPTSLPTTKVFLINGQPVTGTLDTATGHYTGTVNGVSGYLDGGPGKGTP